MQYEWGEEDRVIVIDRKIRMELDNQGDKDVDVWITIKWTF
jgi:hypothetical protein